MKRLTILVGGLLLAGCNLAPTYERPAPAIAPSWPKGDAYLAQSEAQLPEIGYQTLFHDPKLLALIDRAYANNQDLKASIANVAAARGTLRATRAALFPQFVGGADVTVADNGRARSTNATGGRTTLYTTDVGLSAFEIDLFGRVRNLSDAALQEYLGTEVAVRAFRISLAAEVANAWLATAADRSLLAIVMETERTASRSVELTRARLSGGVAPRSDLRQAETILATARADRASLTTAVAQDRNALELLVGQPVPDDLLAASIESVDGSFDDVPAGLDSRVLLRRPDVVQAEYTLRAANARIGAARAAFFPTISLTATAGFASSTLGNLFTGGAFAWSAAPALSVPIFDAGLRRGNLEVSEANRDAALAQYQKAIQTAFREVADALARRGTIADQLAAQTQAVDAAQDTYVLADARYREGVDPFLSSLDAQRTLYAARRSLASTRLVRASNLVELYRTLGSDAP